MTKMDIKKEKEILLKFAMSELYNNNNNSVFIEMAQKGALNSQEIMQLSIPPKLKTILYQELNTNIKEPTKKLPYDVPLSICEMLKEDAKKEGIPATKLLIKLIEENHEKTKEV